MRPCHLLQPLPPPSRFTPGATPYPRFPFRSENLNLQPSLLSTDKSGNGSNSASTIIPVLGRYSLIHSALRPRLYAFVCPTSPILKHSRGRYARVEPFCKILRTPGLPNAIPSRGFYSWRKDFYEDDLSDTGINFLTALYMQTFNTLE